METRARQHGPCWRVMETGHPSTRAVNSGSGNRALGAPLLLTVIVIMVFYVVNELQDDDYLCNGWQVPSGVSYVSKSSRCCQFFS